MIAILYTGLLFEINKSNQSFNNWFDNLWPNTVWFYNHIRIYQTHYIILSLISKLRDRKSKIELNQFKGQNIITFEEYAGGIPFDIFENEFDRESYKKASPFTLHFKRLFLNVSKSLDVSQLKLNY